MDTGSKDKIRRFKQPLDNYPNNGWLSHVASVQKDLGMTDKEAVAAIMLIAELDAPYQVTDEEWRAGIAQVGRELENNHA